MIKNKRSFTHGGLALFLLFFLGVLGLDQLSKYLVNTRLHVGEVIPVIPGIFSLVSVRNRGAAFGFLNRSDIDWQIWLFLGAAVIAAFLLYYLARTSPRQRNVLVAAGCILGGATGNMIDRFRFGAVTDFLDIYWQKWHWPAFNIADMAICLGGAIIIVSAWKQPRPL